MESLSGIAYIRLEIKSVFHKGGWFRLIYTLRESLLVFFIFKTFEMISPLTISISSFTNDISMEWVVAPLIKNVFTCAWEDKLNDNSNMRHAKAGNILLICNLLLFIQNFMEPQPMQILPVTDRLQDQNQNLELF